MNGVSPIPMDEDQTRINLSWICDDIKLNFTNPAVEGENISCVQYDGSGNFLAYGDRGGKISILKTNNENKKSGFPRYEPYCAFVSHESEFDYLKSLEIEEKINRIRWLPQQNSSRHLLSTNDKTIKLWRLSERPNRSSETVYRISRRLTSMATQEGDEEVFEEDLNTGTGGAGDVPASQILAPRRIEAAASVDTSVVARCRRVYANAHAYHVNSISVNSDQETFLSADDLRINLWHLNVSDQSFNIVDIKPANMEELSEVITSAEFHPTSCSLFMYSSSKGIIRLCDMRQQALCDKSALTFQEVDALENRGFFSEIVNSITDLKFSNSNRYVLSRDYLTLKVWDMNMPTGPVEVYHVHDYLRSKFVALYENDCIFDKFECAWSPDNNYLITGSYNNLFRVFDRSSGRSVLIEAAVSSHLVEMANSSDALRTREVTSDPVAISDNQISVDSIDYSKKLLYMAWHPSLSRVAMASNDSLFMLSSQGEQS
ncbi:unnamed protein product [Rodentolepis nana]|uniref:Serine/threonine-protein phosphatase 2A 55 kDa regulatory subunit B n=1 Tax=Rodentolepis nana TaxID=102285 RepID=A0A0R3TK03_RODNA|nr:unnamed protein product [Rodentolepis nana]